LDLKENFIAAVSLDKGSPRILGVTWTWTGFALAEVCCVSVYRAMSVVWWTAN